jgi:hypothetical protein
MLRGRGTQGLFKRLGVQSGGRQNKSLKWAVVSAVFAPGGQFLATAEGDGTAKLRDPNTGDVITTFEGDDGLRSVAFAPDGETLAAGSPDMVRVWRLLTKELVVGLGTDNFASCVTFSPDGKTLAVGGDDLKKGNGTGNVKLYEVGSWKVRATLDVPPKVAVSSVAFAPDSKILATANSDGTVRFWDAANGKVLYTLPTGRVDCAVFSPDGRLLATGGDNAVKLWAVATREMLIALPGVGWLRVNTLAFSPDGTMLASGSADRVVRLWDVAQAVALSGSNNIRETSIPVQHADPMELARLVRKRLGDAASVKIEVHPQRKELVIRANAEQTQRVKEIISQLDEQSAPAAQRPLRGGRGTEPVVSVERPRQIEAASTQQFTGRLAAPPGDPIGLTFSLDERSYLEYQRLMSQHKVKGPGSPLYVGLSSEEGFPHEGRLVSMDDRFNPAAGTIQAQGSMPNPGRLLLPGMFVRVRMPFGPPQKLLEIPGGAVVTVQGEHGLEHFVFVVNDKDVVERRVVKVGALVVNDKDVNGKDIVEHRLEGSLRIVEKGLDVADWVVVGGGPPPPGTHVKKRPLR